MLSKKSEESALRRRIAQIKQEISSLGDLRPGNLSEQYNVCGKAGCQCKDTPPKRHGPYFQLSWARHGKSTTRFIREQSLAEVQQQLKNYRDLRELVDEWVDIATELCERKLKADRERISSQAKKR